MKKRTLIFSIAALVIVLTAVPFAMAQHMRGRHGHGGMFFGLGFRGGCENRFRQL